jgi:hypothetical protein
VLVSSWSRGGVVGLDQQPAGFILNLDRDLGERLGVLAVVVSAEQQFAVTGK